MELVEFKTLLSQNIKKVERTTTPYSTLVTANVVIDFQRHSEMDPRAVPRLRAIAEHMSSAGRLLECIGIYKCTREDYLDACFLRLGVHPLTNGVGSMRRDQIEAAIDDCRRAAKVFVAVLFPTEKSLSHQIFSGLGTDPFLGTVEEYAKQLFDFAEALSCTSPSHENLIKIIALKEGLSEVLPQVNEHFQCKPLKDVRNKARGTVQKLDQVATAVLKEFPDKVLRSNVSTKHPEDPALPRYVMKNIMIPMVSTHKKTLSELITRKPVPNSYELAASIDLGMVEVEGRTNPLSLYLMWIIVNLVYNLRGTSRNLYKENKKNASRRHLFTMKNISYIVEKIEGCQDLKEAIGDDFQRKLTKKLHQAIDDYVKSILEDLSKCLQTKNFYNSNSALTENLAKFNAMFVEVRRSLATIVVSDTKRREEYRNSMPVTLVPLYKSFHGKLVSRKITTKYSPEDLAARINNFFRTSPNTSLDW